MDGFTLVLPLFCKNMKQSFNQIMHTPMKTYFILSAIFLMLGFASCDKNDPNCQISIDCDPVPYDSGDVVIEVSIPNPEAGTFLVVYNGYVENKDTVWSGTVFSEREIFYLPVGKRYAAEAYYPKNNAWLVALDGKKLKKDTYDECGETCHRYPSVTLDCKKQ